MKHLLPALLLTVGVVAPAWAQQQPLPVDSTTHKITYSAVVQVPGASQAELYGHKKAGADDPAPAKLYYAANGFV